VAYISVLLLALAVSFDGFGAGFSYGVRRLNIPLISVLIICLSSSLSVFLSMKAGCLVAGLFNLKTASIIGGLMLVAVGLFIVFQSLRGEREEPSGYRETKNNYGNRLSMVPSVMREPALADFDSSGTISGKEAVVLGVALAMDAFGAGFGAAMMGYAPGVTAVSVGITKFVLLTTGMILGRRYSRNLSGERAAFFSGVVLMLLGVVNIM
jgi:putative sporulation protein YtaF